MQNQVFGFASELKALLPLRRQGWSFSVDRDALATYMRYGYVPTPHSIYQNVSKLEAGQFLQIDAAGRQQFFRYWDASDALQQPSYSGTYQDALHEVQLRLEKSVKLRMASDVPLGAFLSGGIDSSLIVALMQSLSTKKIKTFSIGFYDKRYNEAAYAKAVACHLGAEHADLYVTDKMALDVIPSLSTIYDEPFADSSQIPTFLVSQLARQSVAVSLTGDAGDELFGGYNRYLFAPSLQSQVKNKLILKWLLLHTPSQILSLLGGGITLFSIWR